jgi:membrane-bound lytic murein transglycosylase B
MARLRAKGINEDFLELVVKNYREEERPKVLDLNLLGFLKTRPPQDERVPRWELDRVRKFIFQNRHTFRDAEKRYAVPREVIASLLWVETKYGRDAGTFHVASSFFSIAQADYPTILDAELDRAKTLNGGDLTPEIEAKVADRSRTKADWAANELLALQEIHQRGWKDAVKLKGSFSGAFGMAQFLPSSYISWSRGKKEKANLFEASDSILSVANYLTANGWKKKEDETHKAALFHYNRDVNYVNRILRMGTCLKEEKRPKEKRPEKRQVASSGRYC